MLQHKNNNPVYLLHRSLSVQANFPEADRPGAEHDLYLLYQTFAVFPFKTLDKLLINFFHLCCQHEHTR